MWHYQRVHAINIPLVSSHNALQPVHWLVAALRSPREHWVGPTWAWQEKTQRLWFFNDGKWEDVLILLTSSRGIHANLVKHIHISCECKGWNKNTLNKYIVSDCGNPIVVNTLSRRGNATTTLQAVGATSKVTECQQVCRFCQLGNGSKPTMPCSADEHHN